MLWRHVGKIKAAQLQTPRVVVCGAGTADGAAFEAHLIEDLPDGGEVAASGKGGYTFEQFVEFNQTEMLDAIKEQRRNAPDED